MITLHGIAREENKLCDSESIGFSELVSNELYDLQIQKLNLLKELWTEVWLGKINWHNDKKEKLVKYTGQKLYNFSYDFAIPCNDSETQELLKKYNDWQHGEEYTSQKAGDKLDEVLERVKELGGLSLFWS